jgi:hypothetical protein
MRPLYAVRPTICDLCRQRRQGFGLTDYCELELIEDQKRWLAEVGPITTGVKPYKDFYDWKPALGLEVYHHGPASRGSSGHSMMIAGYDDIRNCWIVRSPGAQMWATAATGTSG